MRHGINTPCLNYRKSRYYNLLFLYYITCVRGFEPPTPWSVAKCSIQLSYTHIFCFKCRRPESNRYGRLGPQDFKSCASASSATPAFLNACKGINANCFTLNGTYRARTYDPCLLYTSPSPRDGLLSRMPSSA